MGRRRLTSLRRFLLPALASALLAVAGCSSQPGSSSSSTPASAASSAAGPSGSSLVTALPASVRANYVGWQSYARVFADPYKSWTPPPAPWKFCESTNYLANGWELGNQAELSQLVAQYRQAGLAKGNLVTTNSNLSVPTQISQINDLIAQGCNVIFAIPGSPTAFCPTFAKAFAKGVLVVTDDTPIYCQDVMNSSFPEYSSAQILAEELAKALGGKGNVVIETGIPGAVGTKVTVNGFLAGLKNYPGIHVSGQVAGDWTESVVQSAMVNFLATNPAPVNGILDGAGMGTGGELALQQAGRPLAKESLYEPECSAVALWKQHPGLIVGSQDQGPTLAAYESFLVAGRMLAGQKPDVNTLLYPIPGPTQATFDQWYQPSMTIKSSCFATPPASATIPDSYYSALFTGGKAPKVTPSLTQS
jgi:ribose transport system substrate-binding protein